MNSTVFQSWSRQAAAPRPTYTEAPKITGHPCDPWQTRSYTTRLADDLDQKEIRRLRGIAEDMEVRAAIMSQRYEKTRELVRLSVTVCDEWKNLRGLQRANCGSEFVAAMRALGRYVGVMPGKR